MDGSHVAADSRKCRDGTFERDGRHEQPQTASRVVVVVAATCMKTGPIGCVGTPS
jgi:hypothetical protein